MNNDNLTIMGKVTYKQVVTQAYKEKAAAEIQLQIDELNKQLEDFDKQVNKAMTELTLKAHPQTEQMRQQFNVEREKINIYKKQLEETLKEIAELEDGNEVEAGEGNFVSEITVGSEFSPNLSCEVVIKDDKVIEIRK